MSEWRPDITKYIYRHIVQSIRAKRTPIKLRGARRSSKTWTVCQFSLLDILQEGDTFVFATMTDEQGRLGSYEDCKNIIESMPPGLKQFYDVAKSPRQITCKSTPNGRHGVIIFKSFQDSETAKGVACDYVFINEANKFTYQQYLDLAANARKGVILDYNPQEKFWVTEKIPGDELVCTWQKNRDHLTDAQLQWFQQIYDAAHSPNATAADWYYYLVYYCGEYSELTGNIFTRGNIDIKQPEDVPWERLTHPILFTDPSALRDADYFPAVIAARDKETGEMWVLDVDSTNSSAPAEVGGDPKQDRLQRMLEMAAGYDGTRLWVESNGLPGIEFIENYCNTCGQEWRMWHQTKDKFERIVAHYQELTRKTHFVDNPRLGEFLKQVYEFSKKCEHDDNIDCVNSAWMVLQYEKNEGIE